MTLSSVDLPAPLGPTTLVQHSARTLRLRPEKTVVLPSCALQCVSAMAVRFSFTRYPRDQTGDGASATASSHRPAPQSTRRRVIPEAQSANGPVCLPP